MKNKHIEKLLLVSTLLVMVTVVACEPPGYEVDVEREAIAQEMETVLQDQMLSRWYPLLVDEEHGGFLSNFSYDWQPFDPQNKMIVTQGRHTWSTAKAALFYPDDESFLPISTHGFTFLRDVMWDKEYGGFYGTVDREGNVIPSPDAGKSAYGNAFGIYGLAAFYEASGNEEALELAQEAFVWLEEHSHDPVHKGYFQTLARDGTPNTGTGRFPPKDQNSSIHVLEALTELYNVWPDSLLRERLLEMLLIVRDTITYDTGYLALYSYADWTPVSYRDSSEAVQMRGRMFDHVSFGHDIETAYLMLEASHVLGLENDEKTMEIAKKMVDHTLRNGFDETVGGIYDAGYYYPGADTISIIRDTKNWWAQAEGLNSMLLMSDYFPNDELQYFEKFKKQWDYIKTYLIDFENGGWYEGGLDKHPEHQTDPKSHVWKSPYHTARSMMNCIARLRGGE